MKKIIFIIFIILVLIFLYGRYIEPTKLNVKQYVINTDKISESFKDIKIVHFSDLLYKREKDNLNKLKDLINKEEADIIVFTGDLFDSNTSYSEEDYNDLKEFLTSLNANFYKYAVYGEEDEKYLDKFKDIMYDSNFVILDNTSTLFFYKDVTPINIIGITNIDADINSLLQSDIEYNYSLVIMHKPDYVDNLKEYNVDTVLSGHSLGGIINIPYYGGLIKMSGSNTYVNGNYKIDNTELFVNNGIGYKLFLFRLFNTPSISVYRFNN